MSFLIRTSDFLYLGEFYNVIVESHGPSHKIHGTHVYVLDVQISDDDRFEEGVFTNKIESLKKAMPFLKHFNLSKYYFYTRKTGGYSAFQSFSNYGPRYGIAADFIECRRFYLTVKESEIKGFEEAVHEDFKKALDIVFDYLKNFKY